MKVPGSIYKLNGRAYILLYPFCGDVYRAPLPSISEEVTWVAHTTYTHRKETAGIDVFYLDEEIRGKPPELDSKRWGKIRKDIHTVDPDYNVHHKIVQNFPHEKELIEIERSDIRTFCEEKNYGGADNPGDTQIEHVEKIIPRTRLRKPKEPKKPKESRSFLSTGKEIFVNFYSKDGSLGSCLYQASIDVASGCLSGFVPLDDNARFDGEFFTGFLLNPYAECSYPCYKMRKHSTFPTSLFWIDRNKLRKELATGNFGNKIKTNLGHKVEFLRIAKNTEAGSKYTLDSLVLIMETCCETKTRPYLITKYLKCDKNIVDLFKRSNGVLSYTYGFDNMEIGAGLHGCNNEFRLEQAKEYKKNGVDVMLTVLIDGSGRVDKRLEDIIEFSKKYSIRPQLLPLKVWEKGLVMGTLGKSWEDLKISSRQKSLFGTRGYGYSIIKGSGGSLVCHELHPEILELVGDNKGWERLCHYDSQDTFCGGCGFSEGDKGRTKHMPVKYRTKRKRRKKEKNQMLFPFPEHV